MAGFKTRRDSSTNNVPVVGYQDSADAQDIILWGAVQVTETGNTDADGIFTTSRKPIIDITHDWVTDGNGVPRERLVDGADITAKDSSNNPLYPGQADGKAGTIPLYTDSGHTTSAANLTGVQVTFYTLAPIAIDTDGKLRAIIDSPLNASGNVKVAVTEELPAGSNTIGGVNLASPLPSGNNIVGKVIIRNTADGGGEDNSIRIRDSAAGNRIVVTQYNSDSKSIPNLSTEGWPLLVGALQWLYNGDMTMDRKRNTKIYKQVDVSTAGDNAVWTPTTGKKFRLLRFVLACGNTATTVYFKDGATKFSPTFALAANQVVEIDLGNGYLSSAANNVLNINLSSANPVGVWAMGTEE